MKYLVTGKEMKLLDQNTSGQFQVPTQVLMEQAAMVFVQELLSFEQVFRKVLVVCGSGNNGADGIAIARLLNQRGIFATVFFCQDKENQNKQSELYLLQKKIYQIYRYPVADTINENDPYDCVIDAVFGIGLSRAVTGSLAETIRRMNAMHGKKVAVDIASGVSADTGELLGTAFRADDTITFSFGKAGQFLWPGAEYSGCVHVVPMGITKESWLEKKPRIASLETEDLSMLPKRCAHSNKGTYGKLLVIAGSVNMAGAAYFSAKAAYRCGTGLVKVYTAEENRSVLQTSLPEAVLSVYGKNMDKKKLIEELKWADAVVLGPGIGTGAQAEELLKTVLLNIAVPLVLDADALNLIAKEPEVLLRPHTEMIVTPHLGEMSRLTGDAISFIQTRLLETAQDFAQQYDVICVLKDAHTVTAVPYGLTYLNLSGNQGMATAGSGDVLSGIIGSFLAQGLKAETAAALGVYVHGLAGDAAQNETGARGMTASDIVEGLPEVWNKVDKENE